MLGYHVAKAITVLNEKNNPILIEQDVINSISAVERISNDLIIIFGDFKTAVDFALYDGKDIKCKNEIREHFPIFEFLVKDPNKIEKLRIDETGTVVEKGGVFDAWRTEYSNLIKIRATLSYISEDIPDFIFNTKTAAHKLIENKRFFSKSSGLFKPLASFLLRRLYQLIKTWEKTNERNENNPAQEKEDLALCQQVKDLQKKFGIADDPQKTSESDLLNPEQNVQYKQNILGRKKQTLAELVAANDRKKTEQQNQREGASYRKKK